MALQSLESNPQLSFATRMEDWTSLGQHKRHPEFPVVTRESCRNSRKSTWFPRHRKKKPFPIQCLRRSPTLGIGWFAFHLTGHLSIASSTAPYTPRLPWALSWVPLHLPQPPDPLHSLKHHVCGGYTQAPPLLRDQVASWVSAMEHLPRTYHLPLMPTYLPTYLPTPAKW